MEIIATTPFGQRPVSACLMKHQEMAHQQAEVPHYDKWELFRELCVARFTYGVTDRDLTVLNALLSFHQSKSLSDNENMVVFPSNAALSDRAHGMAESTLRRHLGALVKAGLILRHDSPNGKRYAAKDRTGAVLRAFGFNLRPMLVQAGDIVQAATEARQNAEKYRLTREEASVLLRDAAKLTEYGIEEHPAKEWKGIQGRCSDAYRAIRRKLDQTALEELLSDLHDIMKNVQRLLGIRKVTETNNMSGSRGQNERHYQNSNINTNEFEPCLEKQKGANVSTEVENTEDRRKVKETAPNEPRIPIGLVLKTCPDINAYAKDGIDNWYDLVSTAHFVRGMMGISPDAWQKAQIAMGSENAAIVLACMLQKVADIHSPGGYLRALTWKAEERAFSPGPMVMALLNGSDSHAA